MRSLLPLPWITRAQIDDALHMTDLLHRAANGDLRAIAFLEATFPGRFYAYRQDLELRSYTQDPP